MVNSKECCIRFRVLVVSLPPDRFDFSDLATPSQPKASGGEPPSTAQEGGVEARKVAMVRPGLFWQPWLRLEWGRSFVVEYFRGVCFSSDL